MSRDDTFQDVVTGVWWRVRWCTNVGPFCRGRDNQAMERQFTWSEIRERARYRSDAA